MRRFFKVASTELLLLNSGLGREIFSAGRMAAEAVDSGLPVVGEVFLITIVPRRIKNTTKAVSAGVSQCLRGEGAVFFTV